MKTYVYEGKQPVFIPEHGIIQPGQTVESESAINRPDFKHATKEEAKKAHD